MIQIQKMIVITIERRKQRNLLRALKKLKLPRKRNQKRREIHLVKKAKVIVKKKRRKRKRKILKKKRKYQVAMGMVLESYYQLQVVRSLQHQLGQDHLRDYKN